MAGVRTMIVAGMILFFGGSGAGLLDQLLQTALGTFDEDLMTIVLQGAWGCTMSQMRSAFLILHERRLN